MIHSGRSTGGRRRQGLTTAATVTLLGALVFVAPTTGRPTPAAAAAAVTQRLIPPQVGPRSLTRSCDVTVGEQDYAATLQDLAPGVSVCFKAPTTAAFRYRMVSVKPKAGQQFFGLSGQFPVVLSGARELTKWAADTSRGVWYTTDAQDQNPTGNVNWNGPCLLEHPMCRQPEELFFNDAVQRPVDALAKVEPGTWFFDHAAKRIYVGSNPVPRDADPTNPNLRNPVVETSVAREAFASAAADVTIENLVVEKYATFGHAATIGGQYPGPNWSVNYTEVRNNHAAGIALNGGHAQHNYVHHNGEQGICGVGADNVVDGNEIAYNNTAGYDFANNGGAGKFSNTTNLQYRNNYVHDNYGMGPWTDGNNVGSVYDSNIVDDNDGAGIMHEISFSATIRNNLLRGNGRRWGSSNNAAIFISSSRDATIAGNSIVVSSTSGLGSTQPSARMGITILQGVRYQEYCDGPVQGDSDNDGIPEKACVARNNTVENNTIEYTARLHYLGGGVGYSGSGVLKDPVNATPAGNVFRGNTYLAPDCGQDRWFWVDTAHNDTSYRWAFKDWQSAGNDTTGSCRTTS